MDRDLNKKIETNMKTKKILNIIFHGESKKLRDNPNQKLNIKV